MNKEKLKDPSKMSERELLLVAHAAYNVLSHRGYGGWDLQAAYGQLEKVFAIEEEKS